MIKLIAGLALFCFAASAQADARDELENLEKSELNELVTSVAQAKKDVPERMTTMDGCGVGSCINTARTDICSLVGALDIHLANAISETQGGTDPDFPISKSDLRLFKLIWAQCKPTTYQYWNHYRILHVWYEPGPTDHKIRQALGIPTRTPR